MQITGTLKQKFPLAEYGNQGKKKGGFLLTVGEADKAKTIFFTAFEKTHSTITSKNGDLVTVDFSIESREYNGKYYTDCIAWAVIPNVAPVRAETKKTEEPFNANVTVEDDLPF